MAKPQQPDATIEASDFIQEADRNVDPTLDEGRVPVLEADGKLDESFLSVKPLSIQDFDADGTWTKPAQGTMALIEIWGAGASGACKRDNDGNNAGAGGGSGGAYRRFLVALADLENTEVVSIGDGGASVILTTNSISNGNAGQSSSFKGISAQGGVADATAGDGDGAGGSGTPTPTFGEEGGGGSNGAPLSSTNGDNTLYAGPGGSGGGMRFDGSDPSTGVGGQATFSGSYGGDGKGALNTATATDGYRGGGGGGAASKNGTATSGKGGDGYVKVTVF